MTSLVPKGLKFRRPVLSTGVRSGVVASTEKDPAAEGSHVLLLVPLVWNSRWIDEVKRILEPLSIFLYTGPGSLWPLS